MGDYKPKICRICGEIFVPTCGTQVMCKECQRINGKQRSDLAMARQRWQREIASSGMEDNSKDIRKIAKEASEQGLSYGQMVAQQKVKWEHNCKTCLYQTESKKPCDECRRDE